MKTKNFYFIAAVALLTACSHTDADQEGELNTREIKLSSSVAKIGADTRAAFENHTLADDNTLEAIVLGSVDDVYTDIYSNGTMTFIGDSRVVGYNDRVSMGDTYKYPTDATSLFLTGFYPITGWTFTDVTTASGDTPAATAVFTITGKEDLMVTARVEDEHPADYTSEYKTLAFNHMLTWIKIKLTGETIASETKEITVTSLKLTKVNDAPIEDVYTFTLADGDRTFTTASTSAETATILNCYDLEDAAYTSADPVALYDKVADTDKSILTAMDVHAYILAPAVTATDDNKKEYTFEIAYTESDGASGTRTQKQEVVTDLGGISDGTNLMGKFINLNLHFDGSIIKADATVGEWADGGSHGEEI